MSSCGGLFRGSHVASCGARENSAVTQLYAALTQQQRQVLEILVSQLSDVEADLSAFTSAWELAPGSREREGCSEGKAAHSNEGLRWLLPSEHELRTRHGQQLRRRCVK